MCFQVSSIDIIFLIQVGFLDRSWTNSKPVFSPAYDPYLIHSKLWPIFSCKTPRESWPPWIQPPLWCYGNSVTAAPLHSSDMNQALSSVSLGLQEKCILSSEPYTFSLTTFTAKISQCFLGLSKLYNGLELESQTKIKICLGRVLCKLA